MINLDPARAIDPVKTSKSGDIPMIGKPDEQASSFSEEIEKTKTDDAGILEFTHILTDVASDGEPVAKTTTLEPIATIRLGENRDARPRLELPPDMEIETEKVSIETPLKLDIPSPPTEVAAKEEHFTDQMVRTAIADTPVKNDKDNLDQKPIVIEPEPDHHHASTRIPSEQTKPELASPLPIKVETSNRAQIVDAKPETPGMTTLPVKQSQVSPPEMNAVLPKPNRSIDTAAQVNESMKPAEAPKPTSERPEPTLPIAPTTKATSQTQEVIPLSANDPIETLKMSDLPLPKDRAVQTQSLQASSVAQSVTPKDIMGQISGALARPIDNGIEVRLSPAELGRIVLHITEVSGQQTVAVSADSKEIVDLLKRHETLLEAELKDAGYDSPSFLFSEHDQSDETPKDSEFTSHTDALLTDFIEVGALETLANRSDDTSRLDIRL